VSPVGAEGAASSRLESFMNAPPACTDSDSVAVGLSSRLPLKSAPVAIASGSEFSESSSASLSSLLSPSWVSCSVVSVSASDSASESVSPDSSEESG